MARMNFQSNKLAETIGVAPSALSNWLNGYNVPKPENIVAIARALGCDSEWLKGEDVPEVPQRAGDLRETPILSYETEHWKFRAITAERQLQNIRNSLQTILDATAPPDPSGEPQKKPLPERIPGTSFSSTTPAARAALKRAGEMIPPEPPESSQSPATDEPTAQTHVPDPGADKG